MSAPMMIIEGWRSGSRVALLPLGASRATLLASPTAPPARRAEIVP